MNLPEIERQIEKFEGSSERFTQGDPSRILLIHLTRAVWELALQSAKTNDLLTARMLENPLVAEPAD